MRRWSSWHGKLKARSSDFIVGSNSSCNLPTVTTAGVGLLFKVGSLGLLWVACHVARQCHALVFWQPAEQQMWDGRHKHRKGREGKRTSPFFEYLAQPCLVVGTDMIDLMPFLWVPSPHSPIIGLQCGWRGVLATTYLTNESLESESEVDVCYMVAFLSGSTSRRMWNSWLVVFGAHLNTLFIIKVKMSMLIRWSYTPSLPLATPANHVVYWPYNGQHILTK